MSAIYQQIVDYCCAGILKQTKRPLLVAIAGDSGSGKSYFSQLIRSKFDQEKIPYTYIDFDDFLVPRIDREPMKHEFYTEGEFKGKSKWEILENMFHMDKFQQVINDLKAVKSSTYLPYERTTGSVSTTAKTIQPAELVIFDTSMKLEEMDYIILVDVTQENIINRKLVRDRDLRTPEQIIEMHKRVQGYYWSRKKPQNPDIIIDNNDFKNPKVI